MNSKLARKIRQVEKRKLKNDYKSFCKMINDLPFWKRIGFSLAVLVGKL